MILLMFHFAGKKDEEDHRMKGLLTSLGTMDDHFKHADSIEVWIINSPLEPDKRETILNKELLGIFSLRQ